MPTRRIPHPPKLKKKSETADSPRPVSAVMDLLEKVVLITEACLEKKALDIVTLDLRPLVAYTDCFIICSGTSKQHVSTVADYVREHLRELGLRPQSVEGERGGHWVLMDYGDVVLHIFEPETREFYAIEKLWLDAEPLAVKASVA